MCSDLFLQGIHTSNCFPLFQRRYLEGDKETDIVDTCQSQSTAHSEGSFWKPPGRTACFIYSTAFYKHLCAWHGGCWTVGCSLYSSPDHASWEVLAAVPVKQGLSPWVESAWVEVSGRAEQGLAPALVPAGMCPWPLQGACGEGLLSLPCPWHIYSFWPITPSFCKPTYFSIGL